MYGIYKRDQGENHILVGVCYTKVGAKRSCEHFKRSYANENGHCFCHVEFRPLDSYWQIKIGYNILHLMRTYEKRKLARLTTRESINRALREIQEAKIRSLY